MPHTGIAFFGPRRGHEPVTEKHLESAIADLCRRLGLLRYHTFRSDKSEPGFPDEVIVSGDTALFWELKTERGKPSPAQTRWLEALRAVRRLDVRIVRPADLQLCADILTKGALR